MPAQDILVTVKLSGVVTMGYSWLITARCGYHVLSMQSRAWDGRRGGGYTNYPYGLFVILCL